MDPLDEVFEALGRLFQGQADLEARIERMFRKGKVTDVDATKHLYRQEIGLDDDQNPVKSPWLPYSQIAGARKSHSPPSVGEQYLLINPDGSPDFTQGLGVPHGWYDKALSPSTDPAADVTTRGSTIDTTKPGSRVISADKQSAVNIQKDGWVMATVKGTPKFVIFDAAAQVYYQIDPAALKPTDPPPAPQ
jgi:hypothetical protein